MKNSKIFIFIMCLLNQFMVIQTHDQAYSEQSSRMYKKKYTLVTFMAADNNLYPYAWNNIRQMEAIGSNENINIIVQINVPGNQNITQRYFIEKGKKVLITTPGQAPTKKLNSGDPQTLVDCVTWAMQYYPADNLILNLWNHGSGIYDPRFPKNLEIYNNQDDSDDSQELTKRGICFDDTFRSYMNNQDIKFALDQIQYKVLNGKKISVLWLEACLMSMIEVTNIFKDHVDYVVSSENVEYAPGSNYQLVLNAFTQRVPSPREFACHIVNSFQRIYGSTKLNYTQSAIDLSKVKAIEENVDLLAQQLIIALQDQTNKSVVNMLRKCKSRPTCTCFHEPSYIDLRHFYMNLQANIGQITLTNSLREGNVKIALLRLIDQGMYLINNAVMANATGYTMENAYGLSIYFPESGIFNSYFKSNFAQSNNWSTMLAQYIFQSR